MTRLVLEQNEPAEAAMRALVYHGPWRKAITHRFGLDEFDQAYDVFARAADTGALKVVLSRTEE
jgi:threonine dehydrogenase-like Zn-dependent dehydrogenase